MPSYRVRRAAHYMMAMGLWRPPVDKGIQTPLPSDACEPGGEVNYTSD